MKIINSPQSQIKTLFVVLILIITCIFCNQPVCSQTAVEPPARILENKDMFLVYWGNNVKLGYDYIALDSSSKMISKVTFLTKLITGNYLPLRMKSVNDTWCYKLYPLDKSVNHDIKGLISAYSREYYPNYARKGQIFPSFNYVDLNGNIYNDETTRGKIIVLKFWFIRCLNCVKEMPEVNALYKKYKTRKDIIFLSLAFDPKKDLQQFLTRTRFDVPVIPASANYIENTLNVRAFPTIMIINKDRKILKVANDAEELKYELKKLY